MADTEVLQVIRIIDDKIATLMAARNQLAVAFGIEAPAPTPIPAPPVRPRIPGVSSLRPPANSDQSESAGPTGRKVELARFLATRGPTSRSEITENSGIPEGTISYCLNDKRFFEQTENGLWQITEFSRRGLQPASNNGNHAEAH